MTDHERYLEARAEAQAKANRLNMDVGLEKVAFPFGGYTHFLLPSPERRYGHELRCEVVEPERGRKVVKD